jgi:hypothetical protein
LRRKLDDPKRPRVLVPVTTFHKFLRYSASRLGSVSPGVLCYSGCQPSKAKSPVAGLFAGHLASSRTRSAIRSHLCARTVVLRYAARIMRPRKRCGRGAQRERSPQSEGAQISHDTCLHGCSPFKCVCVCVKAEECGAVQPQPHPEVRPYPKSSWQLPATCQS